ncbi:hypothetical protein P7C73_g3386, partial [Tremellales sp. Uapishka_1]
MSLKHTGLLAKRAEQKKAIWSVGHDIETAKPGALEVLVRTAYVALNPYDWQGVKYGFTLAKEERVLGRDGAGIVESIGQDVTRFAVGDRVWFCSNLSDPRTAAFQQYSIHHEAEIGHLPSKISLEQGATLGTGCLTSVVALMKTLGAHAIQMAKKLGLRVVCTAAAGNKDWLNRLGADAVVDRSLPLATQIRLLREITHDELAFAIDNVGKDTAVAVSNLLQGSKRWRRENNVLIPTEVPLGKLVTLVGSPAPVPDELDAVRKIEAPRMSFSTTFYGQHGWSRMILNLLTDLLETEELVPGKYEVIPGGLAAIEAGLSRLENGNVSSGVKLIVSLQDDGPDLGAAGKRKNSEVEASVKVKLVSKELDQARAFEVPGRRKQMSVEEQSHCTKARRCG